VEDDLYLLGRDAQAPEVMTGDLQNQVDKGDIRL